MIQRIVRGLSVICVVTAACACSSACTNGSNQKESAPERPAPSAPPSSAPAGLESAHNAYLDGDYLTMSERIRDVLLDPASSELVKQNAYELLDKGYEATNGKLPSRLTLPAGYVDLEYRATHGTTQHGARDRIMMRGRARDASHLKGLTLRRLPDQTILLDKQSGKGKFDLRDDEPGFKDFVLELEKVPALPEDGVFTVRMELDDGSVTEGWFIGRALTSSATPEVKSPSPSASLSDPNPIVSWTPFRSPQYAPYERRTLNIWIGLENDDGMSWNLWTGEPGELSSAKVGAHPGTPSTKLVPGEYWLSVAAGENRKFGPVRLQRESQTVMPIHIVR
jgi:hypothetical protein